MTNEHSNTAADVRLRDVMAEVCENCLNGVPGQCHVPGCLFIRFNIANTPQPLKYLARVPRVFRDGETVPAGVCVLTEDGEVRYLDDTGDCQHFAEFDDREPGELCEECSYPNGNGNLGPLVEVVLPNYQIAVEADCERRQAMASGGEQGE